MTLCAVIPGLEAEPFAERIIGLAASRRTAWNVYVALREDPAFAASYELVKKRVVAKASHTKKRGCVTD